MNKGWPRHFTTTCWPAGMVVRSTSVEPSASAAEDGFIWSMKGQANAAAPTAPMAPDATYRKSRRVPASCVVAATGFTLEREKRKERPELLPQTSAGTVLTR